MVNGDDQAARDAERLLPNLPTPMGPTVDPADLVNEYVKAARPVVAAALRERDAQSRLAIDENAQLRDIRELLKADVRERDARIREMFGDNMALQDAIAALEAERDQALRDLSRLRPHADALEAAYALKVEDFAAETRRFSTLIERLREHGHREQPPWPTDCWICRLMAQACGQEQLSATTPAERERDGLKAENERLEDQLRRTQGYEAHIVAENERLREALKQERELLWHDVIAYGTGSKVEPVRFVIINDTFAYATADAEEVSDADLPVVHDAWQRWGHHGVTAWVALRRGAEPLEPLRTKQYRQARAALAEERR